MILRVTSKSNKTEKYQPQQENPKISSLYLFI
jgi:hypothetical protein